MNANGSTRRLPLRRPWLRAVDARIDGQIVEVITKMRGRVDRVLIAENQLVEKGDLLVALDPRELDLKVGATAAELDRAAVESFAPSPEISRARRRYLHARLDRLNADVRAPVAGRVLARNVQPREFTALAQPLVSILDSDDLWVLARFGVQDFDRLRIGQRASVRAGGRLFAARVAGLIGPEEPALLDFIARPVVALRPGMIAATAVAAG
jgi:multidrug resistance efflux pump